MKKPEINFRRRLNKTILYFSPAKNELLQLRRKQGVANQANSTINNAVNKTNSIPFEKKEADINSTQDQDITSADVITSNKAEYVGVFLKVFNASNKAKSTHHAKETSVKLNKTAKINKT